MDALERAKRQLVIANRILAMEGVLDAYGHVSMRHPLDPGRFLLSHSLSPELVMPEDIVEFTLDGQPVDDRRTLYRERFIHSALYEARADNQVVVHAHAEPTLPFGLTNTPLRAVINGASDMGAVIPVWDIADKFGDRTDTLVTNMDHGRDLAKCLGPNSVVLMRGHGFSAAGTSIIKTVFMAVHVPRNARVLLEAMRLGEVKALSLGEIETRRKYDAEAPSLLRGWRYWATRAGCAEFLDL